MLPPFDECGYLPPGIHVCSIDELAQRFGHGSPERLVELSELREFFGWCRQNGVARILVNGSFTTDKAAPNDVDVVVLFGHDNECDEGRFLDDVTRWPFLHLTVAVDEEDFGNFAMRIFGTDRRNCPNGVVEVLL